jgi:hypothetical protein
MNIAKEVAFRDMLEKVVKSNRSVQRADKPTEKVELDPTVPEKAMSYYYQVRSNMVHRGKGMPNDHQIVLSSCRELLEIFTHQLLVAKAESRPES